VLATVTASGASLASPTHLLLQHDPRPTPETPSPDASSILRDGR
jgi:hypothetical protein